MMVYFEIDVGGEVVTIGAKTNNICISPEKTDLNIFVIKKNNVIPLYDYVKNIEDIERVTDACLDELLGNLYTGNI